MFVFAGVSGHKSEVFGTPSLSRSKSVDSPDAHPVAGSVVE